MFIGLKLASLKVGAKSLPASAFYLALRHTCRGGDRGSSNQTAEASLDGLTLLSPPSEHGIVAVPSGLVYYARDETQRFRHTFPADPFSFSRQGFSV